MTRFFNFLIAVVMAVILTLAAPAARAQDDEIDLAAVAAALATAELEETVEANRFNSFAVSEALLRSARTACEAAEVPAEGESEEISPACEAASNMEVEKWRVLQTTYAAAIVHFNAAVTTRGDIVVAEANNALAEVRAGETAELAERINELEAELTVAQAALADTEAALAENAAADEAAARAAELETLNARIAELETELGALPNATEDEAVRRAAEVALEVCNDDMPEADDQICDPIEGKSLAEAMKAFRR